MLLKFKTEFFNRIDPNFPPGLASKSDIGNQFRPQSDIGNNNFDCRLAEVEKLVRFRQDLSYLAGKLMVRSGHLAVYLHRKLTRPLFPRSLKWLLFALVDAGHFQIAKTGSI